MVPIPQKATVFLHENTYWERHDLCSHVQGKIASISQVWDTDFSVDFVSASVFSGQLWIRDCRYLVVQGKVSSIVHRYDLLICVLIFSADSAVVF